MSIVNQLISFFEGYSETISCKLNYSEFIMLDHILVRSDRLQIDSYYKSGDEKLYASESEMLAYVHI